MKLTAPDVAIWEPLCELQFPASGQVLYSSADSLQNFETCRSEGCPTSFAGQRLVGLLHAAVLASSLVA